MTALSPRKRPPVAAALDHVYFWDAGRRCAYLEALSDFLERAWKNLSDSKRRAAAASKKAVEREDNLPLPKGSRRTQQQQMTTRLVSRRNIKLSDTLQPGPAMTVWEKRSLERSSNTTAEDTETWEIARSRSVKTTTTTIGRSSSTKNTDEGKGRRRQRSAAELREEEERRLRQWLERLDGKFASAVLGPARNWMNQLDDEMKREALGGTDGDTSGLDDAEKEAVEGRSGGDGWQKQPSRRGQTAKSKNYRGLQKPQYYTSSSLRSLIRFLRNKVGHSLFSCNWIC